MENKRMRPIIFTRFIPREMEIKKMEGTEVDVTATKPGTGCWSEPTAGVFHGWGMDWDQIGETPVNYTVGIVEDRDGNVFNALPDRIKFADV
jgi:hypothetical protein